MENLLSSQFNSEPDSNLNLSKSSPSSHRETADTVIIEDDDVLPASPVPVSQSR